MFLSISELPLRMLLEGYSDNKVRLAIIKKYGQKCQYCKKIADISMLHIDHIDPKNGGGKDTLENYTLSCANCNETKGSSPLEEPGRSYLITLAKRNAPSIMKFLIKENLRKVRQILPSNPITRDNKTNLFGQNRIGSIEFTYSLPIDRHGTKVYDYIRAQSVIQEVKCKDYVAWNYRLFEVKTRDNVNKLLSQFELNPEQFKHSLDWLSTIHWTHYQQNDRIGSIGNVLSDFSITGVDDNIDTLQIRIPEIPFLKEFNLFDSLFKNQNKP